MNIAGYAHTVTHGQSPLARVLCLAVLAIGIGTKMSHLAEAQSVEGAERHHAPDSTRLEMTGPAVEDEDISCVANPEKIGFLDLSRSHITDRGMALLPRFVNLKELMLTGCPKISDAGIAHLGKLRKLDAIHLHATRIGDAGIEHLYKLKQLKYIGLRSTRLSRDGVRHLQAEIPGACVDYFLETPGRAFTFAGTFTVCVLVLAYLLRATVQTGTRATRLFVAVLWLSALVKLLAGCAILCMTPWDWQYIVACGVMTLSITYLGAVSCRCRIAQRQGKVISVISAVFWCIADFVVSALVLVVFSRLLWTGGPFR